MRLICTINDQKKGLALSSYLQQKGIENQVEVATNTDWGSPDYGSISCTIWVTDEDRFEEALTLASEFMQDADNPKFHLNNTKPKVELKSPSRPILRERQPMGLITLYLLIICSLLLIVSNMTSPEVGRVSPNIPYSPLVTAPVYKKLMYDYPQAFEIIDNIVATFGINSLQDPSSLPKEGQDQLKQFYETPYWRGLYEKFLQHYNDPSAPWVFDAPMFEKIRQGEVWRIFTPCILHSDILHLLFNMIWLVVLGKQMEQRLGKRSYATFIIITACISNTAQYLMSGSSFLGFSGVLCAMLAYIWIRQKKAAWEGYQLEGGTIGFIAVFILLMFTIQIVSFFMEAHTGSTLPVGIANTAHLTGALSGYLLGRTNWFVWQGEK